MSDYYVPLFSKIVDSSIWCEEDYVVKVFMTLLAKKERGGVVRASAFMIAQWAKKTEVEVLEALKILSSPDTKRLEPQPFEGRRIERVEGGWLILNAEFYQDLMMQANRRIKNAEAQARWREKQKANGAVPQGTPAAKPERPELFMPTSVQLRLGALFRRKATTAWSLGEMKAFKAIGDIAEEDLAKLEAYYRAKLPENTMDIRRRDLVTMLNNFSGEMDRARSFKGNTYL